MNSGLRLVSGLPYTYDGQDIDQLLEVLDRAVLLLDTLGQLQSAIESATGGGSMGHRASQTFDCHANLGNYVRILKSNRHA